MKSKKNFGTHLKKFTFNRDFRINVMLTRKAEYATEISNIEGYALDLLYTVKVIIFISFFKKNKYLQFFKIFFVPLKHFAIIKIRKIPLNMT